MKITPVKYFNSISAACCAATAYCCMYAIRKPFTILTFDPILYWGISYKVWLIIAQVLGYALSKSIGIKLISELKPQNRLAFLYIIILVSVISLFLFAITPPPYGIACLFFNGLPLGLVWGVVFSYLEGRVLTDVMSVLLASSFIFSSGFVKSIASQIMDSGIKPMWVPCITGLVFIIPFFISNLLLNHFPGPDEIDIRSRVVRKPMVKEDRIRFFLKNKWIIILLTIVYILLSVLRDFRDNFAVEILKNFGKSDLWQIARIESNVSFILLITMSMMAIIQNHLTAIRIIHWIMSAGFLIAFVSTIGVYRHWVSGVEWYWIVGICIFMGYIPFNSIFIDRLISVLRHPSNAGFLMYFMDSAGYLFSVLVMISKELIKLPINHAQFFMQMVISMSVIGFILSLVSYNSIEKSIHKKWQNITL